MERTGGAFLLQETNAIKLVGSLVSGIDESGRGWVRFAFFQEAGTATIIHMKDRVSLALSRTVGMAMISLLHVLVAQIGSLRSIAFPLGGVPPVATTQAFARAEKDAIVVSWSADAADVVCAEVGGQIEMSISEAFAHDLALALTLEFGRFAAAVET